MVTFPTYHICLICTGIKSLPQGGLPPQGALLSPVKWPWYGLHTAVPKKPLRRVCIKFASRFPRSESKGHLIVRVCRSGGAAGGPSSYRRRALGGNAGGGEEVTPSTTAQVDDYEGLRDCLGGGTYVSQSPRRVVQGSLGRMVGNTHTHTHTHTHTFNDRPK